MNIEKIGKFIAKCRKEKKITQLKLAELLGVSNRTISKWETGRCMPDYDKLNDLCNILDVSINELLSGEKLSKENYQENLEKNMVNLVDSVNHSFKNIILIIKKIIVTFMALAFILFITWKIDDVKANNCEKTIFHTLFHVSGIGSCLNLEDWNVEYDMIDQAFKKTNDNEIKFVSYINFHSGPDKEFIGYRYYSVYEEIYEVKDDKLYFVENNYDLYKTTFSYEKKNFNLEIEKLKENETPDKSLFERHLTGDTPKLLANNVDKQIEEYSITNNAQFVNREQKLDFKNNKSIDVPKSVLSGKLNFIIEKYGINKTFNIDINNTSYILVIGNDTAFLKYSVYTLEYINYNYEYLNKYNGNNILYGTSVTYFYTKNDNKYDNTSIDDFNLLNKIFDEIIEKSSV